MQQQYFLFKQLCKSCQNTNKLEKCFYCWGSYGKKQPLQIFYRIVVLKDFAKIRRKTSVLKSPCVKAYNFIKKRLRDMCFPVNFAKFSRIHFLKNTSRRLLLCRTYFFFFFLCWRFVPIQSLVLKTQQFSSFWHSYTSLQFFKLFKVSGIPEYCWPNFVLTL